MYLEMIINGKPEHTCVKYGSYDSPFGEVFIAKTPKGVCELQFINKDKQFYVEKLGKKWGADIEHDQKEITVVGENVFINKKREKLHIAGTEFQIKVWKALLNLPAGELHTYKQVAEKIGQPSAYRAVANAIGKNPLHYIIPCHRIVRTDGSLGGYAGGIEIKKLLLRSEKFIKIC